MGLIAWIIFGGVAGWVASLIVGNNDRQGCLKNIIVGILGAFLGGLLINLVTGNEFVIGWDWRSFGVAVLGSAVLLWITGAGQKKKG
jgi:uncharacterized membrane protein YeaQ/YmgE (transglycosylase-associated protein family)